MYNNINNIIRFIKGVSEKNIAITAAGVSFFLLLSSVPILITLCSLLPYTQITEPILVEIIASMFPRQTESFLTALVTSIYHTNAGVLSVSILITIWSAGKGMLSLIRGLNDIHDIVEHRGYVKLRAISSLYTVLLLLGVILLIVLLVFSNAIYQGFLIDIPILGDALGAVVRLRFLIGICLQAVFYTLLYTYVPYKKQPLAEQVLPASLAAATTTVFSYGFSIYVDYFNDFSGYGSVSIIIIIMLWLYFTIYIILYGAYIGYYF
ncbi:MAG: YihY/virulence factor BrkB family protein [Lachnospiraceae bacterium]